MHVVHDVCEAEVAEDGDEIRYDASLSCAELDGAPSLVAAVEMDEDGWEEYGEEVDECEHHGLIEPGQEAEVSEHEQEQHAEEGEVEGCEEQAYDFCG